MAFGSGSSFATDRWMRRGGLPSSAQAFSVGSAKRLHQHSSQKPTAHSGSAPATSISRSLAKLAFFLSYKGSAEVIHRFARIHLTRRRRNKVARMVSPETRSVVSPSSKATSATISKVQRLDSRPNSLGERWSICLSASALFSSKAACTRFGRDEPGVRASRPLSLKARMAFLTVCEAHPRLRAIFRGRLSAGARQKDLAAAHHEGIFGAQPGLDPFALLFRRFPNKDWRFHAEHYSP